MILQNAPDLLSTKWNLGWEKTRGARNSLLQMTMCIWRKMVFNQRLDAYSELRPCIFEVLLRRIIPQLYEGPNVLLYDNIREIVW